MQTKSLRRTVPCYKVSEGTANILQAYHEVKAKINQVQDFLNVYYATNRVRKRGKRILLNELSEYGRDYLAVLETALFENIGVEINHSEKYV